MNNHTIISEKGERASMEDRHFLEMDFNNSSAIFGGVYDGHRGSASAEIASQEMRLEFRKAINNNFPPDKAFEKAYNAIHNRITDKSGTCATNFYIKDGRIYFANAGDCRIIITGRTGMRQLTIDDSVSNEAEKKRVTDIGAIQRGLYFWQGYSGTQVTRSIGDKEFVAIGVIHDPHTGFTGILPTDTYLVAGSDGLFKFVSNEEIQDISKNVQSAEEFGEILKEKVLVERQGSDNLTIIVIDFLVKMQ